MFVPTFHRLVTKCWRNRNTLPMIRCSGADRMVLICSAGWPRRRASCRVFGNYDWSLKCATNTRVSGKRMARLRLDGCTRALGAWSPGMRRDALHSVQDAGPRNLRAYHGGAPAKEHGGAGGEQAPSDPGRRASPTIVRQPERHRMAVAIPDGDDTVRSLTGLWQEFRTRATFARVRRTQHRLDTLSWPRPQSESGRGPTNGSAL